MTPTSIPFDQAKLRVCDTAAGEHLHNFAAYFIGDCLYAMSCVILLLMKDVSPLGSVLCDMLHLNYEWRDV